MLGLQGNTTSPKVYRCVACSATFSGLASLLVHQASHAGALSKIPGATRNQPSINPQETLRQRKDSSSQHAAPPTLLPEGPATSFYICDCGEEFHDFGLMLEHKRSHVSPIHQQQTLDNKSVQASKAECDKVLPDQHESVNPPVTQPVLGGLGCSSTSRMPAIELPTSTDQKADSSQEDGVAIATTHQGQCKPHQDPKEKELEKMSSIKPLPGAKNDTSLQNKTNSVLGSIQGERAPQNNTLMKLLASAYMKRLPHLQVQNQNNKTVIPKQESIPVDITPGEKTEVSPIKDLSIAQLRRLLTKPGIKTKAPSIGRILESSKKRIVSLTKTFSPVVLLETRQKLMDPNSTGKEGRYQCGRCRRVFQNLDRLTEHHFLHKKERIKCCRRCKQLIIGKLPFTDNHVCPQPAGKAMLQSSSLSSKLPFAKKLEPFHSLNHTKKLFFCPLCKHSYSRRYNLKTHKCQGPRSSLTLHTNPSVQKVLFLRSSSKANTDMDAQDGSQISKNVDGSQISKNVSVGTEITGHIKEEVTLPNSEQSAVSELAWSPPAQRFLPFCPKTSTEQQHKDPPASGTSPPKGDDGSWDTAADKNEDTDEGQWTMPLDDEMEMLSSAGCADSDKGKAVKTEHTETAHTSLRFFVRDGVKRYPCNRCQKTYSRQSTLRRHLRLCGFRPHGLGTTSQSGKVGAFPLTTNNMRPMFDCFVCGKTFNRKDNMMVHRKRCQSQRTIQAGMERGTVDRGTLQPSLSGSAAESQAQEDDGGNWGIMSLPSVLPRRVTCECGMGFTSPRLLLEHLQKHAQESYTCPTCGETVNSWADYEVHLQIHMHPHNQLLKGLQPQRSQPLLLRFRQQSPQQQPAQPGHQALHHPPQKQPSSVQLPNSDKNQQRVACTRCGNTFSGRCSLRKHISLNRCKGGRVANPQKNYHCSHCNTDFPNTISLIFHQRSGVCKPTIKPVRCPLCVRWFGTVDDLQKHLVAHKQSESYRCDVCQGTYPNLKSLKNHRRRIHRILVGSSMPTAEQLTS